MFSNYFCTKQLLIATFCKLGCIHILIYPNSYWAKYGTFYLNNKDRVHGLGLQVQLSWRVASPLTLGWDISILIIWCQSHKFNSVHWTVQSSWVDCSGIFIRFPEHLEASIVYHRAAGHHCEVKLWVLCAACIDGLSSVQGRGPHNDLQCTGDGISFGEVWGNVV